MSQIYFSSLKKKFFKEKLLFLGRWAKNPFRMGAVFPSSRALSRKISRFVKGHQNTYVVELGGGTGQLTEELLKAGVPPENLYVIEIDRVLVEHLKAKFPTVTIIQGNAARCDTILPLHVHGKTSAVISGLPLLSFSKRLQHKIIEASFKILSKEGEFVQFTYSPFSSLSATRFGLHKKRAGLVLRNIPPATIWTYQKKQVAIEKAAS